jgi:outer membrane protein assembly factor BamD
MGPLGLACLLLCCWCAAARAQQDLRLQPDTGQFKKLTVYDPASPEGQLQAIHTLLAEEKYDEAWDLADDWIDQHPNQPLLVEAHMLRGDAKVGSHRYYQALFDYEVVVRDYPGSDQFAVALEREYAIARAFIRGVKRRFLGMEIIPADDVAVELLIRIQERAPGHDIGESASLTLGEYYYNIRNMPQAVDAYDMFLRNYPKSQSRELAMKRLIEASIAAYKGPRFDARGIIDAGERIKAFEKEFPAAAERMGAEALLARIEEGLARKALLAAEWQFTRGDSVSAAYCYQRVVRDYPRTASAQEALRQLAQLGAPAAEPIAPTATAPAAATNPAAKGTGAVHSEPGGNHP